MTNRMFSVPYNGRNIKNYLEEIDKRKNNVENIFLSMPHVQSHLSYCANDCNEEYENMCEKFLIETKDIGIDRIVTLNSSYDNLNKKDFTEFVDKISYDIFNYKIDGVICTSYEMALKLRKNFKDLKINTSCNCFQRTIREMEIWNKDIGIDYFNPPRSAARDIPLLQQMKTKGFRIKLLINESCIIGCPQEVGHFISLSDNNIFPHNCLRGDLSNAFKKCWVIPRWLKILDEYVDIYKISGRFLNTPDIFRIIDSYILGDECSLNDIFPGEGRRIGFKKEIMTKDIPDKLLTCKCEECNDGCNLCQKLVEKYT